MLLVRRESDAIGLLQPNLSLKSQLSAYCSHIFTLISTVTCLTSLNGVDSRTIGVEINPLKRFSLLRRLLGLFIND